MVKAVRVEDLAPRYQEQVRARLGMPGKVAAVPATEPTKALRREPSKTELRYRSECLAGVDARWEGLTVRLANGHRYTPDWIVTRDGQVECHEVKGSYRLGSYQRARLAFDQARVEWPCFRWVWAEANNDGTWRVR
jgi:hypothetical protein